MRKLSEIKNEDAVEVLASILDPVIQIATDKDISKIWEKGNRITLVEHICKNHPKEVVDILAVLEGVPREEYEVNLVQIPIRVLELFNDEDMLDFFQSQGLKIPGVSFGSATVNTVDAETK